MGLIKRLYNWMFFEGKEEMFAAVLTLLLIRLFTKDIDNGILTLLTTVLLFYVIGRVCDWRTKQ